MAKKKTYFMCQECGHESIRWVGRCPGCHQFNTMVEEIKEKSSSSSLGFSKNVEIHNINSIVSDEKKRTKTGSIELDRVLGGGLVAGSLVLLGGDPGIGKSTLLLQSAHSISKTKKTYYLSGEESPQQIKLRASRLGVASDDLYILSETDIDVLTHLVEKNPPQVLIVDSIQTVFKSSLESAPGSVAQVRECTNTLMKLAKSTGIPIFIVGHVTKEGGIAGPRVLEHMVDTVLYFEGDRHQSFRILRGVKNRFGSTNEIGVYEMVQKGLREVLNPSELFLSQRPIEGPGSVATASMEGTRPILVEIQGLITSTNFSTPRRMTNGVDYNRVSLLMAVLEKRVGLFLNNHDAFVNVAGGVKIEEPAVDLAISLAVASSFKEKPINQHWLVIGEVGLTGEVRSVSQIEQRLKEGQKLGFKKALIPQTKNIPDIDGISIYPIKTVREGINIVLGGD
ncbi:DNA repair protein RadA [Proteinivorax hydrogeniformans]|uniref:DNA repair protein RadA n=1 Tax=Proteinivorax hydrogeniformans TaxID=1826727 RepID=A0AAU8HTM0_9FIRM